MLKEVITKNKDKSNQGRFSEIKGKVAEALACLFLRLKGYKILARNFSCGKGTGRGEIDIIATEKETLVFVEVKYRSREEKVFYAVTENNKKRVTAAAEYYIGKHPALSQYDVRFDVVLFGGKSFPKHIKDAWRPDWW